jgi:DHA1 family bicyclomycin/chloramphenicol resistance-like MFS transporter
MRFPEFVVFIASCMALNALAIDVMLPALPVLGAELGLADSNGSQAVIVAYLLGFGLSQIFYGPLSDRFGRRPVLLVGLVVFAAAGVLSVLTHSFGTLLGARLIQGVGAGATRVVAVSLVRDTYSGAQMGRVMSLAMAVFMIVPIIAPSMGQAILLVAPWRWVFGALVAAGAGLLLWTLLRLEETLPVECQRSIAPRAILGAVRTIITTRLSAGYMLAMALVMGTHMGFITSAPQIFLDVFDAGTSFTLLFALIALALSVAAVLNARIVHRFGMRRLALVALVALVAVNMVHLGLAATGRLGLPLFVALQAGSMFLFGFVASNLNTLAMEPLGHVAGTASSMIGSFTTSLGAALGFGIGQFFDGSVVPLVSAYVVLGLLALGTTYLTERPSTLPRAPDSA